MLKKFCGFQKKIKKILRLLQIWKPVHLVTQVYALILKRDVDNERRLLKMFTSGKCDWLVEEQNDLGSFTEAWDFEILFVCWLARG